MRFNNRVIMCDTVLKQGKYLVAVILIVTIIVLGEKNRTLKRQVEVESMLIQRVFINKPKYYLDTLCHTEEYYKYMEAFKSPIINN